MLAFFVICIKINKNIMEIVMARPPKNAIHEASYQIKDFFNDESMRRIYPKNPYNVLWFMEQLVTPEELKNEQWTQFKNHVLFCLKNDTFVSHNLNPLRDKMLDDSLVLERIKNIIDTTSIDINTLGLATKGVRMKSAPLIKGLLDMGLNPNITDGINLPLEVALNRKSFKIAMLYWNDTHINRFALNKSGQNYAEIAIKNKQWKFFEIILEDEPQMIYGIDKNNQLNVEKLLSLFNKSKYELSKEDIVTKELALLNNKPFIPNLVPERIQHIVIDLIQFCDEKNGSIDISSPVIKKLWKERMYQNFNEKFQEKPNSVKVKKMKI